MNGIAFFSEDTDFALPNPTSTIAWLSNVIQQEGYTLAQLNIIFCSDRYLHAYNLQYLQHDTLTDVLTFDYTDTAGILEGDMYISIDRVKENAQTWGPKELYTVMVHGTLHLLGYADNTPTTQALMRQKEAHYVNLMPFD